MNMKLWVLLKSTCVPNLKKLPNKQKSRDINDKTSAQAEKFNPLRGAGLSFRARITKTNDVTIINLPEIKRLEEFYNKYLKIQPLKLIFYEMLVFFKVIFGVCKN